MSRTLWGQSLNTSEPLSLGQTCFAGGFSAVPTTLLMTPMERIKVLIQTQAAGETKYKGPVDAIKKVYAEGGIRSLYRGTRTSLSHDFLLDFLYMLLSLLTPSYFQLPTPTVTSTSYIQLLVVATLWRDVPGSVAYFAAYEVVKKMLSRDDQQLNTFAVLFAGGMAG